MIHEDYAVKVGYPYSSPEDPEVIHFLYKYPVGMYDDLYLFMEREADPASMQPLLQILQTRGLKRIHIVIFSPQTVEWKENAGMEDWRSRPIEEPKPLGSYPASDVTFLLKDISEVKLEKSHWMRENWPFNRVLIIQKCFRKSICQRLII